MQHPGRVRKEELVQFPWTQSIDSVSKAEKRRRCVNIALKSDSVPFENGILVLREISSCLKLREHSVLKCFDTK